MKLAVSIIAIAVLAIVLTWFIMGTTPPKPETVPDSFTPYGELMKASEESVSRGLAFLRQSDIGRALFEFKDAIKLDSNNYRAYYNMGLVYRVAGEFKQSEIAYRRCIELAPRFYAAHNNLAYVLRMAESPVDCSLVHSTLAAAAYPDCTDFVDTRIDFLLLSGNQDEAQREWQRAYEINPEHPGIQQKAALFPMKMKGKKQ